MGSKTVLGKCYICHGNCIAEKNNSVFLNGSHVHNKCWNSAKQIPCYVCGELCNSNADDTITLDGHILHHRHLQDMETEQYYRGCLVTANDAYVVAKGGR